MKLQVLVPGKRADVEAWLRDPGRGETVKDNRVRSVHRWTGLYIKRFKNPTIWQKIRQFLFDRAAHELLMLRVLRERGVEAPEPVAWARGGGSIYLFTREIPGARPLHGEPLTRPVLADLARFIRRLHDAGVRHDDLHVGNVLVAEGKLHVVDVHQATFVGELTPSERAEGLGFTVLSIYTRISQTDVLRFIREYGTDPREVLESFRSARERYYLDRQSRVRRAGSAFEVRGDLVLRRPFTEEAARKALDAAPLRVVKDLPNRRLWLADPETFVKEGAARRVWYNGFGLETRGIPTPRLLACRGDRVAGRWIEGAQPLWDGLKARGASRDLLWRLARLVRRMHVRGVWHRDLKANNILLRGDELWVVDLDRVDFRREVPRAGRIRNLAQLNAAVGAPVTRADRLRFFFAYAGRDRAIRVGWKAWIREIMAETRARRHVWP